MIADYENLRRRLSESPNGLDYNELSPTEKQMAKALIDEAEAELREITGRVRLLKRKPSPVRKFLSMGVHG